jgi:drug/metabolite transporter (DMT)-like permease
MERLSSGILLGQTACLGAALLWAVALTVFRRPILVYGARRINLAKCVIAAVLQGITVLIIGQASAFWTVPARSLLFVAASGVVGLALGDTALFGAAARLGVHRALLLQTLAPVFTAILAALWQSEMPTAAQAGGGVVILFGVALVVAPGRRDAETVPAVARAAGPALGLVLGVLAALGQATGLVLAKVGMQEMPVLPASALRLSAAAVGLVIIGAASFNRLTAPDRRAGDTRRAAGRVLVATLLGTYLALFLMMAGVALVPASVAAVLLSTAPVFSLVVEAVVDRRPPTSRGVLGTLLAVAGVAVLVWT